jgi:5-methylcytosine-specific restriction enzyme A
VKRVCAYPRCPNLTEGRTYCTVHQPKMRKEEYRRDYQRRGDFRQRGYGPGWDALSRQVKAEQPVCAMCRERRSEICDHITPKWKGGTDARANLQGLCRKCHGIKTAREGSLRPPGGRRP